MTLCVADVALQEIRVDVMVIHIYRYLEHLALVQFFQIEIEICVKQILDIKKSRFATQKNENLGHGCLYCKGDLLWLIQTPHPNKMLFHVTIN